MAIIALEGDVLEYDPKTKKAYIKLNFYGQYTGLFSVFTTEGNTVEDAKKNDAMAARHFVVNVKTGAVSKDVF